MSFPKYTIKFYDASNTLTYTLTNEAISVLTHNGLNEDVGVFSIQLPLTHGLPLVYDYLDIDRNWTVKVWYDYGSVSTVGLPDFMGKVYQAASTITDQGYVRLISGKGNGEILQRRIKSRRVYKAVGAGTIANELATDLGIAQALPAIVILPLSIVSSFDFSFNSKNRCFSLPILSSVMV